MQPIISSNVRIRHPESFFVGSDSIIDDFCYFSTKVRIGRSSHIASGCNIGGGNEFWFEMGDFSSLSSGVKIWCTSNDFVNDLVMITTPGLALEDASAIEGDVSLAHYTGIGANTVVMPKNNIPVGTVIGALSFVPSGLSLEPWSVYAGIPVRLIGRRNREKVLRQVEQIMNHFS